MVFYGVVIAKVKKILRKTSTMETILIKLRIYRVENSTLLYTDSLYNPKTSYLK